MQGTGCGAYGCKPCRIVYWVSKGKDEDLKWTRRREPAMKRDGIRKMHRTMAAAVLGMLLVLLCAHAAWAYPAIDGSRAASLTLHAADKESGAAISALRFTLYKAADLSCEEGKDIEFTFTDAFLEYNEVVEMNLNPKGISSSSWAGGAQSIAPYVLRDVQSGANSFESYSAVTDGNGVAVFSGLSQGLYLLTGSYEGDAYQTVEVTASFLTIPQLSDDGASWIYDVAADAKTRVTALPEEEESEQESEREMTSVSVKKAWSGDDTAELSSRRPTSITVDLLDESGNVVDTQVLSAQNGWSFSWTGLAVGQWSVAERDVPEGYSVSQTAEATENGMAVTITNTTPPAGVKGENREKEPENGNRDNGVKGESREPEPDNGVKGESREPERDQGVKGSYRQGDTGSVQSAGRLPQTGQLWWPVWVLSAVAAAMVLLGLVLRVSGSKDLKDR